MVDAAIAKSAGSSDAPKPLPGQCRAVLNVMERVGHCVVFSPAISAEWRKHERAFARGWRIRMIASRQVEFIQETRDDGFRDKLAAAALSAPARRAIAKDSHLIEAACATDRIVVSLDEEVRGHLCDVCPQVSEVREILWANPAREEEGVPSWLERGARVEKKRRLSTGSKGRGG